MGELLVVGLAAASLYLLFRRGIVTRRRPRPAACHRSALVAAAGTFGVLRIYPRIMGATQRSASGVEGRWRSWVRRARFTPSLGFAAAFAFIVGVSVAVFSPARPFARSLAHAADPATRGDIAPLDAGHPIVAAVFAFLGAAVGIAPALPRRDRAGGDLRVASARPNRRGASCARLLGRTAAGTRGVGARAGRSRRNRRRRRTGRVEVLVVSPHSICPPSSVPTRRPGLDPITAIALVFVPQCSRHDRPRRGDRRPRIGPGSIRMGME